MSEPNEDGGGAKTGVYTESISLSRKELQLINDAKEMWPLDGVLSVLSAAEWDLIEAVRGGVCAMDILRYLIKAMETSGTETI